MTQVLKEGGNMESMWALGLAEQKDGNGVLASLLFSDGWSIGEARPSLAFPYPVSLQESLEDAHQRKHALKEESEGTEKEQYIHTVAALSREVTNWFLQVARTLIDKTKILPSVIGFSGPGLLSEEGYEEKTAQQAIVETLSAKIRCPAVSNFVEDDQAHGGTGQFIGASYFQTFIQQAMKKNILQEEKQVAVMTIENEATALILGPDSPPIGFVVGPGFCLVDEFTQRVFQTFDLDGKIAGRGDLDSTLVKKWIKELPPEGECPPAETFRPYVEYCLKNLVPLDGISTLVAFTTQVIERRMRAYPDLKTVLLFGRATQNFFMQSLLSRKFSIILPKDIGWNTNFLESEMNAFLAVRRSYGMSISYPTTTGVEKPIPVGRICAFQRT